MFGDSGSSITGYFDVELKQMKVELVKLTIMSLMTMAEDHTELRSHELSPDHLLMHLK